MDWIKLTLRFTFRKAHGLSAKLVVKFKDFEIEAFSKKEVLTDTSVNVKVSTKIINTHTADRDNDLKVVDFFDVEKYKLAETSQSQLNWIQILVERFSIPELTVVCKTINFCRYESLPKFKISETSTLITPKA